MPPLPPPYDEERIAGRTDGVHSPAASGSSSADPVLDILQPLFHADGNRSSKQISQLRISLEQAIQSNKARTHELLIDNYPSISSHIQLSSELQSGFNNVQSHLIRLEKEIDHSDPKTSFLPPLITKLNNHFSASSSRTSARAHTRALKVLKNRVGRSRELEEAIWTGRAADIWVIKVFKADEDPEEEEVLRDTTIIKAIEAKSELLYSFAVQQITDGYNSSISFSSPSSSSSNSANDSGSTLSIQSHINLQHPKTARPTYITSPVLSNHSYPLSEIYLALSRLNLLQPLLHNLHNRLLKDIVLSLVSNRCRLETSSTSNLSILRLELSPGLRSDEILAEISTLLIFIENTVFPESTPPIPERRFFIEELHRAVFRSVLDKIILPSLPKTLSDVSQWLELLEQGVKVENSFSPPPNQPVLKTFFEKKAGEAWANQRRYSVVEDVRRLIVGGWEGWESEMKEREKEVVVLVATEVDEDDDVELRQEQDESFGWGFEDDSKVSTKPSENRSEPSAIGTSAVDESMQIDDGWGFEESPAAAAAAAGPSNTNSSTTSSHGISNPVETDEADDGWDLDPSPAPTPRTVPAPSLAPAPAKPAREAKRLGKKVAKVKATENEYDPWDTNIDNSSSSSSSTIAAAPPAPDVPESSAQSDGWGWDESTVPPVQPPSTNGTDKQGKRKRTEMKEEKRIVKEKYLVSIACEKLIDIAREVLKEIEQLGSISLTSPSFTSNSSAIPTKILEESISDIYALYRALLPTHYQSQIRDVPALSFQAYNDATYLSTLTQSQSESESLVELASYIYGSQVDNQRNGIEEALDDLNGLIGTADERVFRKCERGVKGLVHNITSLSRVIKTVIPIDIQLKFLGEIISSLVKRITNDILNLEDIEEVESNRLTELLSIVQSLENLFVLASDNHDQSGSINGGGGVVEYVEGWLKFCYISEILQANLVDITYLLDTKALVDFEVDELVRMVRALFATSEKRDKLIDKIINEGTNMSIGAASASASGGVMEHEQGEMN